MALFDHRVFKSRDRWWIAQVHSGSSRVSSAGPARITDEQVHFTPIEPESENSRTVQIPAGTLRRMSYRSLVQLLEVAGDAGFRFEMYPYNAPWDDDNPSLDDVIDDEGLNWTFRRSTAVRQSSEGLITVPAIDVVCLDDSAMARQVGMEGYTSFDAFVAALGQVGLAALVAAVKSMYEDLSAGIIGAASRADV